MGNMVDKESGYVQKEYGHKVKRYCQTLRLKDDPELIRQYVAAHSQSEAWPEIREGIRKVGILEMEIYIRENHLFMVVETPLDFDWEQSMKQLALLPRQAEWEAYTALFQDCDPIASSAEKWKQMDRIFYLYE